jgi:UDP-glucose 4-epimerase
MNKVFLTGHKGFIGSHICKKFDEVGIKYTGWDLKDGHDINNLKASDLAGVETVFHLAAQAKVPLSIEKPLFTHRHNITGTLRLLWAAQQAGVKRIIYSASSSAYGEQDSLPIHENMVPNPMSPYATQKLTCEYYMRNFSLLHGIETISLRYFNVYGEDMPNDSAYSACISIFLKRRAEGKPLTIYGGEQTRDFTYVGDVVRANLLAMTHQGKLMGEVVNIGSGKAYSIDEIARAVGGKTRHLEQRKGEPMHTLADITKATNLFNWVPTQDVILWLTNQTTKSSENLSSSPSTEPSEISVGPLPLSSQAD